MKSKISFLFILLLLQISGISQNQETKSGNPPIPTEFLLGNHRIQFTSTINRSIGRKFGFLSNLNAAADYKNSTTETEHVLNNFFSYKMAAHFQIYTGGQWNYKKGWVPVLGVQWLFASPSMVLSYTPSLHFLPYHSYEHMAFLEYRKPLPSNRRWFNRIQAMYEHNYTNGSHDRSFLMVRSGIGIGKLIVGLGYNLDYYGPKAIKKENIGLIFRIEL